MELLEQIEQLSLLNGPSGNEGAVRDYILHRLPMGAEAHVDPLGNLIVTRKGKNKAAKKVMLEAHMDEVGMMITHLETNGLLRFAPLGGISPESLCGKRVRLENGDTGVIGAVPCHLIPEEARRHYPKAEDLFLDIGASSREEALLRVQPGDTAVFLSDFVRFGGKIKGKALDDRVGCALLLTMMQEEPLYDLTFVFTVQEEVGLRGAEAAAFTVAPDYALVVETTTASDLAGVEGEKRVCELGKGPVVSFMDRATIYPSALYRMAMTKAKQEGIPAQTKTAVAGGNDSGAVHKSRGGVQTLAVSLPCRYLHSPACVIEESDLQPTLRLLRALAEELAHG